MRIWNSWLVSSLLLLQNNFCIAQITGPNLVPNPSFENYTSCPDYFANYSIDLSYPWYQTQLSSDYFNMCSPNFFGVPQNVAGYQSPRTGVAMAGIYTLSFEGVGQADCKEYIQVYLDSILIYDRCYLASFFTSLADNFNLAVNNIGIVISQNAINNNSPCSDLLFSNPILEKNNPIISDTLNWIEIRGFYLSNGNEQYITIGNFFPRSQTLYDTIQTISSYEAYYFIDDVSLYEFIETNTTVEAGYDTTIQYGSSVTIGEIADTISNYHWLPETGLSDAYSATTIATPSQTTTYYLYKTQCHSVVDSVTITVEGNLPDIVSFSIFPNPSNGNLTVEYGSNVPITLTLYNAIGQLVQEIVFQASPITQSSLDLSMFSSGVYSYVLKGESEIKSGKLVISK